MAWSKQPKGKPKIVRKRLADGTVKTYEYVRAPAVHTPKAQDSIAALIEAWQRSPEWHRLSEHCKRSYVLYLRPLAPLGHLPAIKLDRREIRLLRDTIASDGRPGAANGFLRTVRAIFGWGLKADWVPFNPAVGIDAIPGGHLPAWTQDQADRAIAELPPQLSRLVTLALFTGQRRGDLIGLRWNAYDGQRLTLTQSKTGRPLVIPCHPALKVALDTWPRVATTILVNARNRPWKDSAAGVGLRDAMQRLGFPADLSLHGLRKLCAVNLAEAGCSAHEIQSVTGHRSLQMVSLYTAAVSQEKLASAAIIRLTDHTETRRKPENIERKR